MKNEMKSGTWAQVPIDTRILHVPVGTQSPYPSAALGLGSCLFSCFEF